MNLCDFIILIIKYLEKVGGSRGSHDKGRLVAFLFCCISMTCVYSV